MANKLTSLATRGSQPHAKNHVVQPALKLLQKLFAGHATGTGGLFEVVAELTLLREVDSFCFLLLAQLETVANDFGFSVFSMLSGSEVALFDGTLIRKAFRAF
jgi:hypothetical protein